MSKIISIKVLHICDAYILWHVTGFLNWITDLTSLRKVLLEKLTVIHLVKKFTAFYGSRILFAVFTRARHWSLFCVRRVQSTISQSFSPKIHSNIIFSSVLSSSEYSCTSMLWEQNFSFISYLSHSCYMPHPFHPHWHDHLNKTRWSVQVMILPVMRSSPASLQFLPLRSMYSRQHSVLNTLRMGKKVSHKYKLTDKIIVSLYFNI
jgi:hypothetical protein